MCAALPSPARERLMRIAGMFGSQFPGERANAAEAATRLLQEHRLTWRDVLAPCPAPRPGRAATIGPARSRRCGTPKMRATSKTENRRLSIV